MSWRIRIWSSNKKKKKNCTEPKKITLINPNLPELLYATHKWRTVRWIEGRQAAHCTQYPCTRRFPTCCLPAHQSAHVHDIRRHTSVAKTSVVSASSPLFSPQCALATPQHYLQVAHRAKPNASSNDTKYNSSLARLAIGFHFKCKCKHKNI